MPCIYKTKYHSNSNFANKNQVIQADTPDYIKHLIKKPEAAVMYNKCMWSDYIQNYFENWER